MKSAVGFVLSLIGAIINLLAGGFFGVLSLFIFLGKEGLEDIGGSVKLLEFASSLGFWLLGLFIWFFIFAILGFIFSSKLNSFDDLKIRKGGIWCLIIGFLSLNLFLIIGGIFGIVFSSKREISQNLNQQISENKNI